jgi:hypothetical protein
MFTEFVNYGCKRYNKLVGSRRWFTNFANDTASVVNNYAKTFCATDIDACGETHDSERDFSSFSVLRMRISARRFTNPGSGITNSTARS